MHLLFCFCPLSSFPPLFRSSLHFLASELWKTLVVIVVLIPLALRGVRFRADNASALLRRNLAIYGLGGLVVPFLGIKLIDLLIVALGVS